ncbi:hypothetical protein EST38_g3114 [Candolleomyces aberdarensis]|uniref:Uncharacterized protein n=1 Tax=Candolleomyces aberdarensis TaxID=2316362 RepID=A0A4Q2DSW4_9AGAR|nr:hypothetical protein EST38_g3114 [Candolleomyces aberdarensis]
MHPSKKRLAFKTTDSHITELEPDDEWKAALKRRIEGELAPMVKDAKDQLETSLRRNPEDRNRLLADHQTAMMNIRILAEEQFREELGRERQERRWAAGMPVETNWMELLREEQGVIYQQIKQSDSRESAPVVRPPTLRPSPQPGPNSDTVYPPTAGGGKRTTPSPQPPERWMPPSNGDLDRGPPPSRSRRTLSVDESFGAQMLRLKRKSEGLRVGEGSESAGVPSRPAVVGVAELTKNLKSTLKSRIDDDIGDLVQLSTAWFKENALKVDGDAEQQLRSEVEEIKRSLAVLRSFASDMFGGDVVTVPPVAAEGESKGKRQPAVFDIAESSGSTDEESAPVHAQVPEARQEREMEPERGQGEVSRQIEPERNAEQPAKQADDNEETVRSQLDKLQGELTRQPKSGRAGTAMKGKARELEGLDDQDQAESGPSKEPERILNQEERRKREWHEQQEKLRRRAEEISERRAAAAGENNRQGNGAWTTPKPPPNNTHNSLVPWTRSTTSSASQTNKSSATTNPPPRPHTAIPNKPRTGSFGSYFPPPSTGGSWTIPQSEAMWAHVTRQQQERFRQEQELLMRREVDRGVRRRN